jgi:hypothetical protein
MFPELWSQNTSASLRPLDQVDSQPEESQSFAMLKTVRVLCEYLQPSHDPLQAQSLIVLSISCISIWELKMKTSASSEEFRRRPNRSPTQSARLVGGSIGPVWMAIVRSAPPPCSKSCTFIRSDSAESETANATSSAPQSIMSNFSSAAKSMSAMGPAPPTKDSFGASNASETATDSTDSQQSSDSEKCCQIKYKLKIHPLVEVSQFETVRQFICLHKVHGRFSASLKTSW